MHLEKKRNCVLSRFAWVSAWNFDKDSPEDIIKCGQKSMIDFLFFTVKKVHKYETARPHERL